MDRNGINCLGKSETYQFVFNAMTMLSLNFIHLRFYKPTGCPRKNVPLGEGQTSPKGTLFLGHRSRFTYLKYFYYFLTHIL